MTQSMTQLGFGDGTKTSNLLRRMVGLCRLELQTSCVSSRRSNQLSYRPLECLTDGGRASLRRCR